MKRLFYFLLGIAIAVVIISQTGCTDATISHFTSLGDEAEITCYSGGKVIYQGRSTGKVEATTQSDGWQFRDRDTRKFTRVSGDCVVRN